jgi:hypothetical protein
LKTDLSLKSFIFILKNPHNFRGFGAGHVKARATSSSPTCGELETARGEPIPRSDVRRPSLHSMALDDLWQYTERTAKE